MADSDVGDQQIVNALSRVEFSRNTLQHIDLRGVVNGLETTAKNVRKTTSDLEAARQEVKDGWWFGNWWHDRKEKVEDLQYNLQSSIGDLTVRTTMLLIFNTAISRELNKQQEQLLQQQDQLKAQTQKIERQNVEILQQQKTLDDQQKEIKAVNEGLRKALGISAEQAIKLINCVQQVESAEAKMEAANDQLVAELSEKFRIIYDDLRGDLIEMNDRLSEKFREMDGQIDGVRQQQEDRARQMDLRVAMVSAELGQKLSDSIDENQRRFEDQSSCSEKRLTEIELKTISTIDENHAALMQMIIVSAGEHGDERQRLEDAQNAQILKLRREIGRRFNLHLIILGFVACLLLAVLGFKLFRYLHY